MNTLSVISSLIGITISTLILKYVYDLEKQKCLCSKDWRRTYIKYFSGLLILIGILGLFGIDQMNIAKSTKSKLLPLFAIITALLTVASFVYLYALYMFSHDLIRHKDCPCSESHLRTFVYYYSILVILLYAFLIFAGLLFFFYIKALMAKLRK